MKAIEMEEAKELFKKLKIHTLLDLALIIPTSYNDTTLTLKPTVGQINTLEAKVIESSIYNGKLRVIFTLRQSGRRLSSTFFRVTPYHHKLFEVGSNHVIQGKLEEYRGYLQMSQPKSIKQVGKITPKYKTVLKESEISTLIEAYISEQNLYNEGLDSKEVATLMHIHFPKSMDEVYEEGLKKSSLRHSNFLKPTIILKSYEENVKTFPHKEHWLGILNLLSRVYPLP
jgi:ATP-dependent DNA helicase RecG